MKATKNFDIKELVHPSYIEKYGADKMCFVLKEYAPFMLLGLEQLKDFIGGDSVTINTYKWGGNYVNSGLRSYDEPVGAELSAHYFMQATDCKFKDRTIHDVQLSILENPHLHPYIVRMEDYKSTPSWLHVQWGYRMPDTDIRIFKP
jgi:hypothetical protein